MRKIITSSILTIAITCFVACGSKTNETSFIVNKDGVSPIVLDLELEKVPASSGDLYDSFTTEVIEDDYEGNYSILHFIKAEKPVMDAYIYDNKIGSIEILSPHISSNEGLSPGSKVKELYDKGGKANMSNEGQLSIVLGDINFMVSGLNEAGEKKIESSYATGGNPVITAEDFESDAKVESIKIYR